MFDIFRKIKSSLMLLLDILCIYLGYICAILLRMDITISELSELENYAVVKSTVVYVMIIHIIFFILLKVNKSLWRYFSTSEVMRVCLAVSGANFVWFSYINWITIIPNYPRTVPVIATFIIIIEMLAIRLLYRIYRKYMHQLRQDSRSIIIGAGDAGAMLAREITYTEKYSTKLVGFLDENKRLKGKIIIGYPVLGSDSDLHQIVEKYKVDTAYVALPNANQSKIKNIIQLCNEEKLVVKVMNYHDDNEQNKVSIRNASIEDILGRPEIKLNDEGVDGYISNKVVFVSGAGGSIGSELCRQIVKHHPAKLILFDIYENNLYNLQQEFNMLKRSGKFDDSIQMEYLIGSVRDTARLDELFTEYKPNVVFHAAAHKHVPLMEDSGKEAIKNNVFGTLNMVQTCINHKVERMILISTDKAVNPTNVMGGSKRLCEMIIQAYGHNGVTKLSAVRFGNVLGSNGSVVPLFKNQIANGGPVTVTHKDIVRFFMTISEAAQLVLQAGEYANDGSIFVLDMGEPMKILKLAEDMIRLAGFKPYEDIDIVFTGLRPGEKMYEELSLISEDFSKTENPLIYKATPLDFSEEWLEHKLDGLKDIVSKDVDKATLAKYILDEAQNIGGNIND